mgnify:CR=1 FL=1
MKKYKLSFVYSGITSLLVLLLMAGCGQQQSEQESVTDRMAEEHEGDEPTANQASRYEPAQPVKAEWVTYGTVGEDSLRGYYAEPESAMGDTTLPGLIVIHEWWGLNNNIKMMARRLAGEGYQALAVDMYGGDTAGTSDAAQQLMKQAMQNQDRGVANLKQAQQYLAQIEDAELTGVIGWCFGGGWSLQAALSMPEKLDAAVIYYGRLVTDADQLKKLNMPILGNFGSEDNAIPPENVKRFGTVLDSLGIWNDLKIYEGAGHAFANPSGDSYESKAARDAWKRTTDFLERYLKE